MVVDYLIINAKNDIDDLYIHILEGTTIWSILIEKTRLLPAANLY